MSLAPDGGGHHVEEGWSDQPQTKQQKFLKSKGIRRYQINFLVTPKFTFCLLESKKFCLREGFIQVNINIIDLVLKLLNSALLFKRGGNTT